MNKNCILETVLRNEKAKYEQMTAEELLTHCVLEKRVGTPIPPTKDALITLLMELADREARQTLGLTSDPEASEDCT